MDQAVWLALTLATLAGVSIPLGGCLALWRFNLLPDWANTEARHGVLAFGAGALLAAVALVLIPEGSARTPAWLALACFFVGGAGFYFVDRRIAKTGGKLGQFLAMMLDYAPEALALGALVSTDLSTAVLVAVLIALQNVPEAFNAMREMNAAGSQVSLWLFAAMVPVGPLCAYIGLAMPAGFDPLIGCVMMLSAGGIVYLMFQDIAPQVPLERSGVPPIGAVLGFGLGLAGHLMI